MFSRQELLFPAANEVSSIKPKLSVISFNYFYLHTTFTMAKNNIPIIFPKLV